MPYNVSSLQSTSKPSNSYTMEQFIALGRGVSVTYDIFSYKEILSNGTEIGVLNVINDYMTEIKDFIVTVYLDEKEYRKYRYKPKLLCNDIYGNPELYYIILLLNGILTFIPTFNSLTSISGILYIKDLSMALLVYSTKTSANIIIYFFFHDNS